jgi:hypothetical protein
VSTPRQTVQVTDYQTRAFQWYPAGQEPYDAAQDTLSQKLWSVVNAELGPNAADTLSHKLGQAVQDHITKGGVRQ